MMRTTRGEHAQTHTHMQAYTNTNVYRIYTYIYIQHVVALLDLANEGVCGDDEDDEGGARLPAYLCAISYDLGSWFFNARKLQQVYICMYIFMYIYACIYVCI